MSRHALHPARTRRRHPFRIGFVALLVLVVAAGVMIRLDTGPASLRTLAANAPLIGAECPSSRLPTTSISVTVAPELESTIRKALDPILTKTLPDGECVRFSVQTQEPAETIQSAAILPLDRAPDIWIPDSSLWQSRVPNWQLNQDGSFATSPVVIASSKKAVEALGWADKNPTWLSALAGKRPLAVPRISEDAAGLSAVIALWQSLGKGDDAQRALAGTVLAAGRLGVPTEAEAVAAAESGSASAPLLPTSQQQVTTENKDRDQATLVAVQPTGGSPTLDYPVLTMLRPADSVAVGTAESRERAVRAVVAQLLNSRSAQIAKAAGFDVPASRGGGTPTTAAAADDPAAQVSNPSPIVGLAPQELAGLVQRITALSAPSRFLTIFDLSGSMRAQAGNGQTRIAFAATAAGLAGDLLTDRAQVGLWGFSRDLQGKKDIIKIEEIAELGSGAGSHREQLNSSMDGAGKLLGGNGTSLFKAAVAGMTEMREQYDPRAGNAVVLFTDGANSDEGGPSLQATLDELTRLYDPKKPVRLICIGIGTGVDMKELRAMSGKAGGQAFLAKDPQQLPQVLFDVMNRRS